MKERKFEVRWVQGYTMFFRWYHRRRDAVNLAVKLERKCLDYVVVDHTRP
jgi:hypothetical protein